MCVYTHVYKCITRSRISIYKRFIDSCRLLMMEAEAWWCILTLCLHNNRVQWKNSIIHIREKITLMESTPKSVIIILYLNIYSNSFYKPLKKKSVRKNVNVDWNSIGRKFLILLKV